MNEPIGAGVKTLSEDKTGPQPPDYTVMKGLLDKVEQRNAVLSHKLMVAEQRVEALLYALSLMQGEVRKRQVEQREFQDQESKFAFAAGEWMGLAT